MTLNTSSEYPGGVTQQLSSVLGYEARSFKDAAEELSRRRITARDLEFFLSSDDAASFRTEQLHLDTKRHFRLSISPEEQSSFEQLSELVRQRKVRFLLNAASELYEANMISRFEAAAASAALKLRSAITGSQAQQHIDPNIVASSKYGWVSASDSTLKANLDKLILVDFKAHFPSSYLRDRLLFRFRYWSFSQPRMQFANVGVDGVQLSGRTFVLADVAIFVRQFDERISFTDCKVTIPWDESPLGRYAVIFGPENFEPDLIPTQTLPLILIRGLAEGKSEPENCRIHERFTGSTTFVVAGYSDKITIDDGLLGRIKSWKDKGGWVALLQHFVSIGAMDQATFEVIRNKSAQSMATTTSSISDKKIEIKANAISELSKEDADRLWRAVSAKRALSGIEWARLLGFKSKQGAFAFLERMEKEGFLVGEKTNAGATVSGTEKAEQYLISLKNRASRTL